MPTEKEASSVWISDGDWVGTDYRKTNERRKQGKKQKGIGKRIRQHLE